MKVIAQWNVNCRYVSVINQKNIVQLMRTSIAKLARIVHERTSAMNVCLACSKNLNVAKEQARMPNAVNSSYIDP